MAGKPKHQYPPDEEFVRLYRDAGCSLEEVGRRFDPRIPGSTLRAYANAKPELKARLEEAATVAGTLSVGERPEEVSELEILREQVKELRRVAGAQRKTDVRDERIIRAFYEALAEVKPKYKPRQFKATEGKGSHEHVLLLSDFHAGEVVSKEETLGLNSYSWDTMLQRMERIKKAVLSFQAHRPYPVRKLNVWLLGDMLSGDIHEDLRETNEWPIATCTVQLGADLANWLEEFVPAYESIHLSGVVGNHPRLTHKPRSKGTAQTNADWILYKYLEAYLRANPAFEFYFPQAKMTDLIVAERWRFLLTHGDGIRSSMVDVPWGGIIRYAQKLEAQFSKAGKPLDYMCCGHWHTQNAVEGIGTKIYTNGSLKGVDEYSLQRFGGARPPGQLLLTMHPKRGVTEVQYLDCIDQHPNSEAVLRAAA